MVRLLGVLVEPRKQPTTSTMKDTNGSSRLTYLRAGTGISFGTNCGQLTPATARIESTPIAPYLGSWFW